MAMSYSCSILPSESENRSKVTSELTLINCQQLIQLVKDSNIKPLFNNFISAASETELESILKCISVWDSCDVTSLVNNAVGFEVFESLWNNALSEDALKYKNKLARKIVGIAREGKMNRVSLNTNAIMFVGGLMALFPSNEENRTDVVVKLEEEEMDTVVETQSVDILGLIHALNNVQQPQFNEAGTAVQRIKHKRIRVPSPAHSPSNSCQQSPTYFPHKRDHANNKARRSGVFIDEVTLQRRENEIRKGKNTQQYMDYIGYVPKKKRIRDVHPISPNKYKDCSRRSWDGKIKEWRKSLHTWKDIDIDNHNVSHFSPQNVRRVVAQDLITLGESSANNNYT